MGKVEKKLKAMGIILPDIPKPVASYVPCVQTGKTNYHLGYLLIYWQERHVCA